MAQRLSGKQRAARIPLDYFKTPDRLSRWKIGLSALALVGAVGWWATGLSFGGPGLIGESGMGRMRYSHGPVARVHATWDARCEACHAPFKPIGQEAWTNKLGVTSADADGKCQSCHQVADHHASMKTAEVGACASCHRDHRGRDASLISRADSDCTSCHADLKSHVKDGGKADGYVDIASFPAKHDEFRLFRGGEKNASDPGTLKFNHALHLAPGMNDARGGKPVFTLGQLSAEDRKRYERPGQKLADGVTLDCTSCHRLDNGDQPSLSLRAGVEAAASQAVGGTGSYMRPVSYRTDCAACHKLDVPVTAGDNPEVIVVPHRVHPSELHERLMNASIGLTLGKDPKALQDLAPVVKPAPGRPAQPEAARDRQELPGRANDAEVAARTVIEARVKQAEKVLYGRGKGTCTECHQYKTPEGIREEIDPSASLASVQIEPTYVPAVWFEHAFFDHTAHRGVSCKECHPRAYPGETASKTSADVMIPNKAVCATCHAPEGSDDKGRTVGGAGQSCTECHRYHGGDHQHALGPAMASDSDAKDIQRFLLGTTAGKPKAGK